VVKKATKSKSKKAKTTAKKSKSKKAKKVTKSKSKKAKTTAKKSKSKKAKKATKSKSKKAKTTAKKSKSKKAKTTAKKSKSKKAKTTAKKSKSKKAKSKAAKSKAAKSKAAKSKAAVSPTKGVAALSVVYKIRTIKTNLIRSKFIIGNNGLQDAKNVVVSTTIPSQNKIKKLGLSAVKYCTVNKQVITCTIPTFAVSTVYSLLWRLSGPLQSVDSYKATVSATNINAITYTPLNE